MKLELKTPSTVIATNTKVDLLQSFDYLIEKPVHTFLNDDDHTMQISCDSFPFMFIFYCSNYSFKTKSFIDDKQNEFKFCLELLDLQKVQYFTAIQKENNHPLFGYLVLDHFLANKKFYFGYSKDTQQYYLKMTMNDKLPNALVLQYFFQHQESKDSIADLTVAYKLLMNKQQFKHIQPLLLNVEYSNDGYSSSFWTSKEGKPNSFWEYKCSKILIKTPKNYVILQLPIKSSLYDLFKEDKEYILEHIEGAKNSVELILGSFFPGHELLKIIGPEWRINSKRSSFEDLNMRLGTYFAYSWHSVCENGYGQDSLGHQISAEIAGLGLSSVRWIPCNNGVKSCGIYQPYDSKYTDEQRAYSQFVRDFEFGQENSSCQIFALD